MEKSATSVAHPTIKSIGHSVADGKIHHNIVGQTDSADMVVRSVRSRSCCRWVVRLQVPRKAPQRAQKSPTGKTPAGLNTFVSGHKKSPKFGALNE